MKTALVAAAALSAALSAPLLAQGAAAPPAAGPCFIQVGKLMAPPPGGISEIGAAIRQLDEALRPQVSEINLLKREMSALEGRPATMQQASADDSFEAAIETVEPAPEGSDARLTRVVTDLAAKQAKLKADYAEKMRAIVGPVQVRVGQSAQAYSRERGCGTLKMARAPDLAALQTAGAQDLTSDFVAWYATNKS